MKLLNSKLFILIFVSLAPLASYAAPKYCDHQKLKLRIPGARVNIGYFEAYDPQGAVIFVQGPEMSYAKSKSLLQNFCRKGFIVAAFDIKKKRPSTQDYSLVIQHIARQTQSARPKKQIIYGRSRGAEYAVRVFSHSDTWARPRLVLENPILSKNAERLLLNIPVENKIIFGCQFDRRINPRRLAIREASATFFPSTKKCGHRMSANAEAQEPLVEFIEADWGMKAGAESWYWTRYHTTGS